MFFLKKCMNLFTVVLLLLSGCRSLQNTTSKLIKKVPSVSETIKAGDAHIQFETKEFNLGSIGPMSKQTCKFKLKNTGFGELNISAYRIGKDCACKGVDLVYYPFHKTIAPGKTEVLEIPYTAQQQLGQVTQDFYVKTNDKDNPLIKLSINAFVEGKIYYEPKKIKFSFDKPNAGFEEIILASEDGKKFSVKKIISTGDVLTTNLDPLAKEEQYVLNTAVIYENLRKNLAGSIKLVLDHPECENITIPFETLPEFRTVPAAITLIDTVPGQSITKLLKVLTLYGESFAIKSLESQNNFVEMIEQKSISDGYSFTLKITPPVAKEDSFNDIISIKTSDNREIQVNCIGLYRRDLKKSLVKETFLN